MYFFIHYLSFFLFSGSAFSSVLFFTCNTPFLSQLELKCTGHAWIREVVMFGSAANKQNDLVNSIGLGSSDRKEGSQDEAFMLSARTKLMCIYTLLDLDEKCSCSNRESSLCQNDTGQYWTIVITSFNSKAKTDRKIRKRTTIFSIWGDLKVCSHCKSTMLCTRFIDDVMVHFGLRALKE